LSYQEAHLAHPKYRADIDGLRAIAVLSVLIFHVFPDWLGGGFIGVDVFFVISGYLISTIIFESIQQKHFRFVEFYSRRINRIFPALIVVLLFSYAFGWLYLLADDFAQLGIHIAGGAGFVSNLILWSESGYFDKAAELKPLLHLWSLGIEEQFYFIWPLFIWWIARWPKRMLPAIVVVALISFLSNIINVRANPVATFYSPITRFWELLVGALLAYAVVHHRIKFERMKIAHKDALSAFGLALILISTLMLNQKGVFPGWLALLPTIGAAVVIGVGSSAWCNRYILSNKALVWFGLISFPLYLWHWPLLAFTRLQEGEMPSTLARLGLVAISILLSWLTYRFVEKPIRLNASYKTHKNIALIFLMLLICYLGYNCFDRKGIQFRHKRMLQQISSYNFDKVKEQRQHTCFLMGKEAGESHFAPECVHQDRPYKIALWGDSHGASMYPGFRWLEENNPNVSVSQFTIAGCGGLIPSDSQDEFCKKANQEALDKIRTLKPNLVVIYKGWHNGYYSDLQKTIATLRAANLDVLVIGPTPRWNEDLPRIVYRYWRKTGEVPQGFYSQGLESSKLKINSDLKQIVSDAGGAIYEPYFLLCRDLGCVIMVPDSNNALVTLDEDHITPAAATYIVKDLNEKVLRDRININMGARVPRIQNQ
jgi:peptidoglycan/LPS O-acetylase OafA/YrhL